MACLLYKGSRFSKASGDREESTRFARDQILRQTATAMLAQANIMPQSVMRLVDLEQS